MKYNSIIGIRAAFVKAALSFADKNFIKIAGGEAYGTNNRNIVA